VPRVLEAPDDALVVVVARVRVLQREVQALGRERSTPTLTRSRSLSAMSNRPWNTSIDSSSKSETGSSDSETSEFRKRCWYSTRAVTASSAALRSRTDTVWSVVFAASSRASRSTLRKS
jgi:hypothetical protein